MCDQDYIFCFYLLSFSKTVENVKQTHFKIKIPTSIIFSQGCQSWSLLQWSEICCSAVAETPAAPLWTESSAHCGVTQSHHQNWCKDMTKKEAESGWMSPVELLLTEVLLLDVCELIGQSLVLTFVLVHFWVQHPQLCNQYLWIKKQHTCKSIDQSNSSNSWAQDHWT